MKVAGTLGDYLNQKVNVRTGVLEPVPDQSGRESPEKSELDAKSVSTVDMDPKMFEGLTAK
jgi:hypothetical protein